MSGGTRTAPPKEEVLKSEDFSNKVAKEWCNEVRVKIFGRGITGTTDKLDKANTKAYKNLKEFDKLSSDGLPEATQKKAKELEKEYREAVINLKHLQDQYEAFEEMKENANKLIEGISLGLIKTSKRKKSEAENKQSILNAEKGMADIKIALTKETQKLDELATKIELELKDAKKKQEEQEKGLNEAEKKKLAAAEKLLETGDKLVEYFAGCDKETAGEIRAAYGEKTKENWYEPTFDRGKLQTDLTGLNQTWQNTKTRYENGKAAHKKNFAPIQKELQGCQEMLGESDLGPLITKFYTGQDAALAKRWGDCTVLDDQLLSDIKSKATTAKQKYEEWTNLKNGEYKRLRDELNSLGDPKYTLMGLEKMAEVVAKAEKGRKFDEAIGEFDDAKDEAEAVLEVATAYPTTRQRLDEEIKKVETQISKLPVEAQGFATRLREELTAALTAFDNGRYVKALNPDLATLEKAARDWIGQTAQQVTALNDPQTVQAGIDKLKETADLAPLVKVLQSVAGLAQDAIDKYLSYGFDPSADAVKKTAWDKTVDTAQQLIAELQKQKTAGTPAAFEQFYKDHTANQVALRKVISETEEATKTGQQTLTNKQSALTTKLTALEKELKTADHLFSTATWHVAAKAELEKLRTATTAASCDLVDTAAARVQELIDVATGYTTNKGPLSKAYDGLKSRLKKVKSEISDKKLVKALPAAQAALLEDTDEALDELRNAGPGLIEKKYGTGTPGLAAIVDIETRKTELLQQKTTIENLRKTLEGSIAEIWRLIRGDLTEKVNQATGKTVNGDALPVAKTLAGLEPQLSAEKEADLKTLEKRLANLKSEVGFLLEEEVGELKKLGAEAVQSDADDQELNDAIRKLEGEYNRDKEKYEEVLAEIKKLKGVDKQEKKRLVGLQKDAAKAAKTNDWAGAARKMKLALGMAETLKSDPQASETTGRGKNELKKLNTRWTSGVGLAVASIEKLKGTIESICKEDDEVKNDVGKVTTPFQDRVVKRIADELKLDMFQQELLVLQADDAKGPAKEKSRENKKKYREQALAKVRRVREIISRDPVFTTVMMSPNPFKEKIAAIQVMRALNDLDLNLQRSV
jgi:hypothetical protein